MPEDDVRQPDAMDSLADGLLGMPLREAQDLAGDLGVTLECLGGDDSGLMFVTSDYREGRVRVTVHDGVVIWAQHG